jgi:hypothetical protein
MYVTRRQPACTHQKIDRTLELPALDRGMRNKIEKTRVFDARRKSTLRKGDRGCNVARSHCRIDLPKQRLAIGRSHDRPVA